VYIRYQPLACPNCLVIGRQLQFPKLILQTTENMALLRQLGIHSHPLDMDNSTFVLQAMNIHSSVQ
jgi:hypothetical protein